LPARAYPLQAINTRRATPALLEIIGEAIRIRKKLEK
jgi:hypothetical protein